MKWTLRLLLGGAFVAAGALKVADPAQFALAVSHYRLAPEATVNLIAIFLPWIEIVSGFCVLAGIWRQAALNVITGLTVIFLFAILSALARGLNIECGCFGTIGGRHVGLVNLAIDVTLLVFAILLSTCFKEQAEKNYFSNAGAQITAPPT